MKATSKTVPGNNKVQGEGDYEAARRYDKSAQDFAQSGKVDEAARKAKPNDPKEAEALKKAEEIGKSRSKGEDPGDAR
ncbi:MAG: hypothetical protein H7Y33_09065 [Cytophagales bacterium]|nr:hypothetical protein [Rhizobacter sp.]